VRFQTPFGPCCISLSPVFSVYISLALGLYPIYYVPWTPLRYYNYWSLHYHYNRSPYYRRIAYVRYYSHHAYYQEKTTSRIVKRNRRDGRYNSTYEGRVFKRPATPVRRPSRREIRRENRAPSRQQARSSKGSRVISQQGNEHSLPQDSRTGSQQGSTNRQSNRQRTQPSTRQQNEIESATVCKIRKSTSEKAVPKKTKPV
jgi:hypothetical protein